MEKGSQMQVTGGVKAEDVNIHGVLKSSVWPGEEEEDREQE